MGFGNGTAWRRWLVASVMAGSTFASAQQPPREGSATASGTDVFLNRGPDASVDDWEAVRGDASLTVTDLDQRPRAVRGDEATLTLTLRSGVDRFSLELTDVGLPEEMPPARLGELGVSGPVQGGVMLWPEVFGHTGFGPPSLPSARAAVALVGVARVTHNGRVVEEATPVQVFALATGVHADDDTNRRLPAARWEDAELLVYAPVVRSELLPGYLLAVFESPRIEVMGRLVPNLPVVPVTQSQLAVGGGGAAGFGSQFPADASTQGSGNVPPPDFAGAEADLPRSVDPSLPAVPLPDTVAPVNAERALPLPAAPEVDVGGPALDTPPSTAATASTTATPDAVPLPQTVAPLNATPVAPGVTPLPAPVNAAPAIPLPPGIPPANALPAATPGAAP